MTDNNILNKNSSDRYQYMLEKAKTNKEVWLLQAHDGLYAMSEDDGGTSYLPVWPEKAFATPYLQDEWQGYRAVNLALHSFIEWLKELQEDQILIAVFPDDKNQSLAIEPLTFKDHLVS